SVGEADPPFHPVLAGQRGEGGIELVPAQAEATALDLHPHEEGAAGCIADMLVGAKAIAVVQGDEAGDRCDQAQVIRAVDQEADVIAHGQSRSLAVVHPFAAACILWSRCISLQWHASSCNPWRIAERTGRFGLLADGRSSCSSLNSPMSFPSRLCW